jgi:hypothetical protein
MDKLRRFKTDLIVLAIMVFCCGGMIWIANKAEAQRNKPIIKANHYPTINNHNYKP